MLRHLALPHEGMDGRPLQSFPPAPRLPTPGASPPSQPSRTHVLEDRS